jgi:hypothetical protein
MANDASFSDLVAKDKWKTFNEHAKNIDSLMASDIANVIDENNKIREEARELLKKEFDVKRCSEDKLENARTILFGGKVAAIDGTHSLYPMLSGIRCQIGVVTTTYENKHTTGVVYVSEQQITGHETSVLGILKRRKKSNQVVSRMLVQAIMFYMERAASLDRTQDWLMFNGELVPFPLRTGVGSFHALEPCLEICKQVLRRQKVIGIIASSTDNELLSLGLALEPGEYVRLRSYGEELDEYLENSGLRGNDRAMMERFNREYGDDIEVGLYKAGARAYIFQAHKDFFDGAAEIVVRDSMFQPLRAYPLLD